MFLDPEETQEVQEGRIEYFKRKGDQQFTKDGRGAEITSDVVLEARAKMSDNKVNGPEDAAVTRDHQTVASRENLNHHKVFPGTLHGSDGSTKFIEHRDTGVFTKTQVEPKKGKRGYRSIAVTSVMSKWYASRMMPRLQK